MKSGVCEPGNEDVDLTSAFDAQKAFVARAFALREENAKLVNDLFEAGAEMHWELSRHMASESMKAYALCIQAFSPRRTPPESAENGGAKSSTPTSMEDHENLCFEEITARLMETENPRNSR